MTVIEDEEATVGGTPILNDDESEVVQRAVTRVANFKHDIGLTISGSAAALFSAL